MSPTNPHSMHDIDDELEEFEKTLTSFQKELSPTPEFKVRMAKRLQRHDVLLKEANHEQGRGFWFFLGTRAYATATAFIFVLFTGGVSTFAYTNDNVTNGNPLYPVKRGLEKIEETFVGSPESHAEFQVKMLGRRLAESRNLTLNGIVDESTSNEVSTVVDNGIQAIAAVEKSDYRDQLLDRVTTMLKDEEKRIYETAGVPYPEKAAAPVVTIPAVTIPAIATPVMKIPAVILPTLLPPEDDEVEDRRADDATVRVEPREQSSRSETTMPTNTSAASAANTPRLEDNTPTSLGAPTEIMNALEKHSQNLRQIELRVTQVRRR